MKKNKLIDDVFLDFAGVTKNRAVKIKFNKKFSKSDVFISKKTGCVFHSPTDNAQESLNKWSKKMYSKKIEPKNMKYTSDNPVMKSRHYYSAVFLNNNLKKGKIKFCDYGTGEGNFAKELTKVNNNIHFNFTEHSPELYTKTTKLIKNLNKNYFFGHNGSAESSKTDKRFKNFDAASLLWTLSTCVQPVEVLNTIHSSLKDNGLLIISESSRILVPFKKPLYNFFVSNHHTQNTHPWLFSFNSLSNLLEICGFRIIKFNRYYDENDLVVIAQKKNKKSHKPNINIDNSNMVIKFFKEWEKNSIFLEKLF